MQRLAHRDAPTAVLDGWELIVGTRVHTEGKYQWIAIFASVMHVMLVRKFCKTFSQQFLFFIIINSIINCELFYKVFAAHKNVQAMENV